MTRQIYHYPGVWYCLLWTDPQLGGMVIDIHQCHLIFTRAVPDRFVGCSTLPAIYSTVGNPKIFRQNCHWTNEIRVRDEPFHAPLGLMNSIKIGFHLNFAKNLEDPTGCPMAEMNKYNWRFMWSNWYIRIDEAKWHGRPTTPAHGM